MTTSPANPLNVSFWEQRYQEDSTRWDLGAPAPPFVSWLHSATAPSPGKAIVLGCGRGHEALLFARHGFEVTAVDFAPSAIAEVTAQAKAANLAITPLQRNIFDLVPELAGKFDYVVEHTCFCALDPQQRPAYGRLVADLLRPQGELLGLFFTHSRPGGPPFGSTPDELAALFQPQFTLLALEPVANSVPARQGEEHRGHFRRK